MLFGLMLLHFGALESEEHLLRRKSEALYLHEGIKVLIFIHVIVILFVNFGIEYPAIDG